MNDMRKKYPEETAQKVCGKLQATLKKNDMEKASQMALDECITSRLEKIKQTHPNLSKDEQEQLARQRCESRIKDLDLFDFIDDFPTYFGRITRAGPFKYPDGLKYKKYDNLKEYFSRIDHLPLYGSRTYGSHDEDKKTTELVGFLHNWVLDDDKKDVYSDIEFFKNIKELSDLKHPENLPISLKFNVADPNSKVQDIRELIHGAVSLNKLELDRCSSVDGYGSCTVSTKTGDFRDTNDGRTSSEISGSDGTGYFITHDEWFDFMDLDKAGQPIKNKKNIAKVEDMGDNNKPHEGNPISKEIEECLKSGKTEEECKLAQERKERTGKEKVGNEQHKDDIKVPKKDFDALQKDFESLQKENDDLKTQLESYEDFEEVFVKDLNEVKADLEKRTKKDEKRKEKKLAKLREDLAKPPYEACSDFLENHDYEFLKEHKKGLDGMKTIREAKTKDGNEDFNVSLADLGEKVENIAKKQSEWMRMT